MKLTMLGCGTSTGIPRIGNDWGVCDPAEPRNRRRRVSVMVEANGYRLLIDTTPDLREQLLSVNVSTLDAVFLTHDHADHAHGIDDLRQVYHIMLRPVDMYMSDATWAIISDRFSYVFGGADGYPATCRRHPLADPIMVGPMAVRSFVQEHGPITSTGFRIEHDGRALAYSTDINGIPAETEVFVRGLDLWVIDACRRTPHPTHAHLAQTLQWIERYRPTRAVLTHMDGSMDYATLCAELPNGVEPGFDGMVWDSAAIKA